MLNFANMKKADYEKCLEV